MADAEGFAVDQLDRQCRDRVGGDTKVVTGYGSVSSVSALITPETTAIAVPPRLLSRRSARKLSRATGLPVTVIPDRAA